MDGIVFSAVCSFFNSPGFVEIFSMLFFIIHEESDFDKMNYPPKNRTFLPGRGNKYTRIQFGIALHFLS